MLRTAAKGGALLSALVMTATFAHGYGIHEVDAELWIGDGDNKAIFIVDWEADSPTATRVKAFGYRWPGVGPTNGQQIIDDLSDATARFFREWKVAKASIFAFGWDVDEDGFDPADPDDWYEREFGLGPERKYWRHYVSGDGESWSVAAQSPLNTVINDGDFDGWSWSDEGNPPHVPTIIPEPATFLVVALGLIALTRRLRNRYG